MSRKIVSNILIVLPFSFSLWAAIEGIHLCFCPPTALTPTVFQHLDFLVCTVLQEYWEAGGNSNVAIAAARLGLCCTTIGHVGNDVYGRFFLDVLHSEGISMVGMNEPSDDVDSSSAAYETLLCWVLVDPLQRHGFCR